MEPGRRAELFEETAARLGFLTAVVEKDFWVCWVLQQIFEMEELGRAMLFKGGTSLSKVYGVISRFSEDIDLAVDYAALGFVGERDPRREGISRTRQLKILDQMLEACQAYIREQFVPRLREHFARELGREGWSLEVDAVDPHIVLFHYPASGTAREEYLRPMVLLEIGTHAELIPRGEYGVRSMAAQVFPRVFEQLEARVNVLLARRTFWEKVTILHAEAHREEQKAMPGRYSRHYYDVAMMCETGVAEEALGDGELLEQVVRHKMTFYPAAWARYDLARPGMMRLRPPEYRMGALRRDYESMRVMIFGVAPEFDWVVEQVAMLEARVNQRGMAAGGQVSEN